MKHKTFILKWNPDISSVSLDDWDFWVRKQQFLTPNWSVYEYEEVNCGDQWFMLRIGDGPTGIVGYGLFNGTPIVGEDWCDPNKKRHFVDLVQLRLTPHNEPMFSTEELENIIPDFDWRGGHSGVVLPEKNAEKLLLLKHRYEEAHPAPQEYCIEPGLENEAIGWDNLVRLFKKEVSTDKDYLHTTSLYKDLSVISTEHDYVGNLFKFNIVLQHKYKLPITCKQLHELKIVQNGESSNKRYCKIWFDGYYFHANINDVQIVCDELIFGNTSEPIS